LIHQKPAKNQRSVPELKKEKSEHRQGKESTQKSQNLLKNQKQKQKREKKMTEM